MSKTILVVEDDYINMRLMNDLLGYLGHACLPAYDGISALKIARERQPDMILLDMLLPGLSGYEVARRIKNDPLLACIPIVAVTACAMAGDEERALSSGCDLYVAKPFSPSEFIVMVTKALEASKPEKRFTRPPTIIGRFAIF